jgi:hypothetical protein
LSTPLTYTWALPRVGPLRATHSTERPVTLMVARAAR